MTRGSLPDEGGLDLARLLLWQEVKVEGDARQECHASDAKNKNIKNISQTARPYPYCAKVAEVTTKVCLILKKFAKEETGHKNQKH